MLKLNKNPDSNKAFLNGEHAIPKATINVVINIIQQVIVMKLMTIIGYAAIVMIIVTGLAKIAV